MAKKLYEIVVRREDKSGTFNVADESILNNFGEMCALAKKLVDDGKVDEALVLEKHVVKRFVKYNGEG